MAERPGKQKLEVLQVGRGFAALSVLALHAQMATRDFIHPTPGFLTWVLSQGYLGVDFFFVLSGFIILQVHRRDLHTVAAARTYLRKRALRIYVPYLPIGLAMVLVYAFAPHLSAGPRAWSLLTSLTLFPTAKPPALSVAWTLVHEVTFYAIFLLFYATRWFAWIMAAWGAALVGCLIAHPTIGSFWGAGLVQTVFDPINLEFLFGMVACVSWGRLSQRQAVALLVLGVIGCVACVATHIGETTRELFGAAVTFVVVSLVALESQGRVRSWAALVALGDASYALYLVHDAVVSVAIRVLKAAHVPWWVALPACILAGLAAGFAYNRLLENPARRWLSKRFDRRSTSQTPAVPLPDGPDPVDGTIAKAPEPDQRAG